MSGGKQKERGAAAASFELARSTAQFSSSVVLRAPAVNSCFFSLFTPSPPSAHHARSHSPWCSPPCQSKYHHSTHYSNHSALSDSFRPSRIPPIPSRSFKTPLHPKLLLHQLLPPRHLVQHLTTSPLHPLKRLGNGPVRAPNAGFLTPPSVCVLVNNSHHRAVSNQGKRARGNQGVATGYAGACPTLHRARCAAANNR